MHIVQNVIATRQYGFAATGLVLVLVITLIVVLSVGGGSSDTDKASDSSGSTNRPRAGRDAAYSGQSNFSDCIKEIVVRNNPVITSMNAIDWNRLYDKLVLANCDQEDVSWYTLVRTRFYKNYNADFPDTTNDHNFYFPDFDQQTANSPFRCDQKCDRSQLKAKFLLPVNFTPFTELYGADLITGANYKVFERLTGVSASSVSTFFFERGIPIVYGEPDYPGSRWREPPSNFTGSAGLGMSTTQCGAATTAAMLANGLQWFDGTLESHTMWRNTAIKLSLEEHPWNSDTARYVPICVDDISNQGKNVNTLFPPYDKKANDYLLGTYPFCISAALTTAGGNKTILASAGPALRDNLSVAPFLLNCYNSCVHKALYPLSQSQSSAGDQFPGDYRFALKDIDHKTYPITTYALFCGTGQET